MDKKIVFCLFSITLLSLSMIGSASSPYISIDLYYNDQLYPNTSIPKPLVKIGEPFTLRFDLTTKQECQMIMKVSDLGNGIGDENFVVISGPSDLGEKYVRICGEDETFISEWELEATEGWSGGSMPIDFHYEVFVKDVYGPVVNGGFTAAYVTISDEYYDGPASEPSSEQQPGTESPSTPAFTLMTACLALAGLALYRKIQ